MKNQKSYDARKSKKRNAARCKQRIPRRCSSPQVSNEEVQAAETEEGGVGRVMQIVGVLDPQRIDHPERQRDLTRVSRDQ